MKPLCNACTRRPHDAAIGRCTNCGNMTPSSGFAFCAKCSLALDKCQFCKDSLSNQPADDPNKPRLHIVSFDHSKESPLTGSRTGRIEQAKERMRKHKAELEKWFKENNLESIEIDKSETIGSLFITCSLNQAKDIAKSFSICRGD